MNIFWATSLFYILKLVTYKKLQKSSSSSINFKYERCDKYFRRNTFPYEFRRFLRLKYKLLE